MTQKRSRKTAAFWLCVNLFVHTKALFEAINAPTGINQLLTAGEERMALGANFNTDVLFGRTGVNNLTASAGNGGLLVIRMDSLFHTVFHLSLASILDTINVTFEFYHTCPKKASLFLNFLAFVLENMLNFPWIPS